MFSAHSRLRHAVADTFAMVVYCTVVNMMIEIFLSGMTFEQSLSSRLVAIPVNIIIAVPYGIYRDFAMRQARRISPARWMKNMADVLAYVQYDPKRLFISFRKTAELAVTCAANATNCVKLRAKENGMPPAPRPGDAAQAALPVCRAPCPSTSMRAGGRLASTRSLCWRTRPLLCQGDSPRSA